MWGRLTCTGFAIVVACLPGAASAQARALHWKSLEVDARIDAEGAMHVSERHHIVFTGDWNGGERTFDLRSGQTLDVLGVSRVDVQTGQRTPLVRGDLTRVDQFAESSDRGLTVRWRNRLPSDPAFNQTPFLYVIDYVLYGALGPSGDRYVLEHDFAFRRPGVIDEVTVHMSADPAWRDPGAFSGTRRAEGLAEGEGFVVRTVLAGNERLSRPRAALQLIAIAVPALLFLALLWHERRRGRLAPLPAVPVLDPKWLADHLLRHPPELVAVLWDRSSAGPHAVAALLSRMEYDGKIRTQVVGDELHMELLVDRTRLSGYERTLVDGFFFEGHRTDTAAVRAHYKKVGFNPAHYMRSDLARSMRQLVGPFRAWWKPLWPPVLAFVVGVACIIGSRGDLFLLLFPAGMTGVFMVPLGSICAFYWRRRLHFGLYHTPMFVVPAILPVALAIAFLEWFARGAGFGALFGLTLVALAYFAFIVSFASTAESPSGLALRRRLTACRLALRRELAEGSTLPESLVPYLFALGLGDDAREWFVNARRSTDPGMRIGTTSTNSSSESRAESSPFGGGGGAFGGAGASGAWVSAVGAMSAGVAAPSSSSSSSGGGSSSSSSSGGGSAGGW